MRWIYVLRLVVIRRDLCQEITTPVNVERRTILLYYWANVYILWANIKTTLGQRFAGMVTSHVGAGYIKSMLDKCVGLTHNPDYPW